MCNNPVCGSRLEGAYGVVVFTGDCWVNDRLFERLQSEPGLSARLHRGFCTVCHRLHGDTSQFTRCPCNGVGVNLRGVLGQPPLSPAEGQRVTTEHGAAVFDGYCWVEAWLYDHLVENPPDWSDDTYEPLCVAELGGCGGCGAYWGNSHKGVRCVFCGSHVSLT